MKLWWCLLLVFCIFQPVHAEIAAFEEGLYDSLICEDGEEFFIEQREIFTNIPQNAAVNDLILVEVDKVRLTFYQEGRAVKTYPVAVGAPRTPSPIGEWKIIHKGGTWGGGFGARWMGINVPWGIYGIHGTNKPQSIGSHASHGCIRMFNSHVKELYTMVKMGTPVHIVGVLPYVTPRRRIVRGNTGKDVLVIQFALRKAGFDPGPADARFGNKMELAVYKFQHYFGLPLTGELNMNEQYLLGLR